MNLHLNRIIIALAKRLCTTFTHETPHADVHDTYVIGGGRHGDGRCE